MKRKVSAVDAAGALAAEIVAVDAGLAALVF